MNYKNSFFYTMIRSMGAAFCIKAATFLKTSYIVGSYAAFFSASSIALPLLGAWSSISTIIATFAMSFLVRFAMGASLMPMLAFWIPGLCAALYWKIPSKLYRIGLPLLCMILFVAHPVGAAAAPYAFYWFIPMLIAFRTSNSIWHHAVASTFTAHAIGSVIWLYTMPMAPAVWLALIPIVACERLLYASGIVIGDAVIAWCVSRRISFSRASIAASARV